MARLTYDKYGELLDNPSVPMPATIEGLAGRVSRGRLASSIRHCPGSMDACLPGCSDRIGSTSCWPSADPGPMWSSAPERIGPGLKES